MPDVVLKEHGPTLFKLAAEHRRRRPKLVFALAAIAALVVGGAVLWVALPHAHTGPVFRYRGTVKFHFPYSSSLRRVAPEADEIVRLERRRHGVLSDLFAVAPLTLEKYHGSAETTLMVRAEREIALLRQRFAGFRMIEEGRARLGDLTGYSIVFAAQVEGRKLYGRETLLVLPVSKPRHGVRLYALTVPGGDVVVPDDAGLQGLLSTPYRDFSFGSGIAL